MRLLLAHPLLSVDKLSAVLESQPNSVRTVLSELRKLSCLESLPTEVGKCWRLRERGSRLLAAANHLHLRSLVVRDDEKTKRSPMIQRGVSWLFQHMQHTAGIYGFFAALARATEQQSEQRLCW